MKMRPLLLLAAAMLLSKGADAALPPCTSNGNTDLLGLYQYVCYLNGKQQCACAADSTCKPLGTNPRAARYCVPNTLPPCTTSTTAIYGWQTQCKKNNVQYCSCPADQPCTFGSNGNTYCEQPISFSLPWSLQATGGASWDNPEDGMQLFFNFNPDDDCASFTTIQTGQATARIKVGPRPVTLDFGIFGYVTEPGPVCDPETNEWVKYEVMYVYLDNTLVGETTGTAGCPSEDQSYVQYGTWPRTLAANSQHNLRLSIDTIDDKYTGGFYAIYFAAEFAGP